MPKTPQIDQFTTKPSLSAPQTTNCPPSNAESPSGKSCVMLRKPVPEDKRTLEQIRQHYQVERELADRLRRAPADARIGLYSILYDELYLRVPLHPSLAARDPLLVRRQNDNSMLLLERFLRPDSVYLEIGSGDCGVALRVTGLVKKVHVVEVSTKVTEHIQMPPNMELHVSDGTSIDVPQGTVTVAYSDQVMEHIHPDDALEQLRNVYRAMAPGGAYICRTPNRLSGPHDISRCFDEIATGMHMREYAAGELAKLLRDAGYSRVEVYLGVKRKYSRFPLAAIVAFEQIVAAVPFSIRKHIVDLPGFRNFLSVTLVGFK